MPESSKGSHHPRQADAALDVVEPARTVAAAPGADDAERDVAHDDVRLMVRVRATFARDAFFFFFFFF